VLFHGSGLRTEYCHLDCRMVEEGARLLAGEILGLAGSTGASTGPHLHWGLTWNGDPLDPMAWLEERLP